MKKRSDSSHKWLQRQRRDVYTQMARKEGLRSRAVFKLKEIQEKHKIIQPQMNVIDLGAAPGGWSEYVCQLVGKKGSVFALDILPMEPIEGVNIICGDFLEESVLNLLVEQLNGAPVDLVISDMAPNLSGIRAVDQPRAVYLVELALDFARRVLIDGGSLLVKVFQGEGIEAFRRELKVNFNKLTVLKPKASRDESQEFYILARGFKQEGCKN